MEQLLEQLRKDAARYFVVSSNADDPYEKRMYNLGRSQGLEIAIRGLEKAIQQQKELGK